MGRLTLFERIRLRAQRRYVDDFMDAAEAAGRADVLEAIQEARASGITIIQILLALSPYLIQFISGLNIDWAAVYEAIKKLIGFNKPQ